VTEYTIKLEQFEGPLDLLLRLIDKEELDITQVSLAKVTEQYIEYVRKLESALNPDELADFLVVATRLLLAKSKKLLPQLDLGEEDSADDLARQLRMYKAFVEASEKINARISLKKFGYSREKLPKDLQGIFTPPKNIDGNVLAQVLKEIIGGLLIIPKLKEEGMKRVISIKEKMRTVSDMIFKGVELGFDELIKNSKDRVEVIVSFLAVLELVKQGKAGVVQNDGFGEILVRRVDKI